MAVDFPVGLVYAGQLPLLRVLVAGGPVVTRSLSGVENLSLFVDE
jgi:hypothetical protein